MKNLYHYFASVAFTVIFSGAVNAQTQQLRIVNVVDGDTISTSSDFDEFGNQTEVAIKKSYPAKKIAKKLKTNASPVKTSIIQTEQYANPNAKKQFLNINMTMDSTTVKLEVKSTQKEEIRVQITDSKGTEVFFDSNKDNGIYVSKDIKLPAPGIYFLNITHSKKIITEKFVVE